MPIWNNIKNKEGDKMENQVPEILMDRTNKLMTERYLSKKDMAERLGMEYLTFWRKLKGKC